MHLKHLAVKGKGCVKDINIELNGLERVLLDRTSATHQTIYRQHTSAERINSQAKSWGIERPKVAIGSQLPISIRAHLHHHHIINTKALQRAQVANVVLRRY